jgi:UDP:flavonoid glycosyltransferase YjiC (YdhE family)
MKAYMGVLKNMARILLTWELGGSMGHLQRLKTLGKVLIGRGHTVLLASRNLRLATQLFDCTGISLIQGPLVELKHRSSKEMILGFADILANVGFAEEEVLHTYLNAWNGIFDDTNPGLVITDYSPFALFALRGRQIPSVNLGVGFYCPPDRFPFFPWPAFNDARPKSEIEEKEIELTSCANRVLLRNGRPRLERLSQLFNQVSETVLATYRELDPFTRPEQTRYWGHWPAEGGKFPHWPAGNGPKVFAYLKSFLAIHELLAQLRLMQARTIIFGNEIPSEFKRGDLDGHLRFESEPLDLNAVSSECDLAISNGGHGIVASMLLAGKPHLIFPIYIEQYLNAVAVCVRAAGVMIKPRAVAQVRPALFEILSNDRYLSGARAFVSSYPHFVPGQQLSGIVERLESHIK